MATACTCQTAAPPGSTRSAWTLPSGDLSRRRTNRADHRARCRADGLTVDRCRRSRVATWAGGAMRGYTPDGSCCRRDAFRDRPTSCAFGGPHASTLFITTARQGLDAAALARQVDAGRAFCVDGCARATRTRTGSSTQYVARSSMVSPASSLGCRCAWCASAGDANLRRVGAADPHSFAEVRPAPCLVIGAGAWLCTIAGDSRRRVGLHPPVRVVP